MKTLYQNIVDIENAVKKRAMNNISNPDKMHRLYGAVIKLREYRYSLSIEEGNTIID